MTRIYKDKEAMCRKLKDAWTPERKQAFGEHIKERFASDPKYGEAVGASVRGIPKTLEQRAKMREAKLGVKKSDEHRAAMSLAHTYRRFVLRCIMQEQSISFKEALKVLHTDKNSFYDKYRSDFETRR